MIATDSAKTAHDPDRLLDVGAVATLLRCSESHVRHLVHRGQFPPPLKIGSLSRWSRDTVLLWCRAGPGRAADRAGPSVVRAGVAVQVR